MTWQREKMDPTVKVWSNNMKPKLQTGLPSEKDGIQSLMFLHVVVSHLFSGMQGWKCVDSMLLLQGPLFQVDVSHFFVRPSQKITPEKNKFTLWFQILVGSNSKMLFPSKATSFLSAAILPPWPHWKTLKTVKLNQNRLRDLIPPNMEIVICNGWFAAKMRKGKKKTNTLGLGSPSTKQNHSKKQRKQQHKSRQNGEWNKRNETKSKQHNKGKHHPNTQRKQQKITINKDKKTTNKKKNQHARRKELINHTNAKTIQFHRIKIND